MTELQPSRIDFPGYFHLWYFAHYLDMQFPTHPRLTDCPGGFRSRLSIGTLVQVAIHKTMYNQPNWFYVSKVLDYESSLWIQPPTNFQGSEPYLPFALFTTRRETWRV